MPETTYFGRGIAKMAGNHLISGSGDAAAAVSAEAKAQALGDLLQEFYQARDQSYDDTDIGQTEVKKAILFARGKKHSKAVRKGVIAGAKFGLQVAALAGGATVGSVVPVLGTALGAVGGAVAGASLGVTVTLADQMKRKAKGFYKFIRHTRGAHREQAAATLMHCSAPAYNLSNGENAADYALMIILGDEYDKVMDKHDTARIADRLKSN